VVEDALPEIVATKQAGFVLEHIPSEAFDDMSNSARTRMYGPIKSRVRVVHLQPIHYLATLLHPSQFDADRACLYFDKAKEELIQRFVTSPRVFRENEMTTLTVDDRMGVLLYPLSAFISATGSFAEVHRRGKRCKQLIVGTAWWRFFGSDYNELSRIAVTVLPLSPSSCVAERSFSQQKNIRSLLRNRLEHSKVKKKMYLYWNLRLLDNIPLDVVDMFESVLELDEDDDFVASLRAAVGDEDEDDDEGDDDNETMTTTRSLVLSLMTEIKRQGARGAISGSLNITCEQGKMVQ
jgi:hAT family C-terminal dimerisation region